MSNDEGGARLFSSTFVIRHSSFVLAPIASSALLYCALLGEANTPGAAKVDRRYLELPLPAVASEAGVKTATILAFTEGPAVDAEGNVYFSDIEGNRIMKLALDGTKSVFRADSGRTNGNTFDCEGRLLHCEGAENGPGGRRRITRTNLKTGDYEVVTE